MKKTVTGWLNILIGCIILAAGFVFFINPYNIVPGGVYGASIVLHNLFPSVQVGTFGYMFDIHEAGGAYHCGCIDHSFVDEYHVASGISYGRSFACA